MNPQVEDEVRKMIIEGIDILIEKVLAPKFVDMLNKITSLTKDIDTLERRLDTVESELWIHYK